jgi:hypothetical protein
VCLETEDGDIILLGLVQLTELATELVLGNVRAVGVEDVAVEIPSDSILRSCVPGGSALTRPSDDVQGGGCG